MTLKEEETTDNNINYFEIIFRLVVMLALVFAIAVAITYFDILKLPGQIDPRYLIVAVMLQTVYWCLSTYSWQRVLLQTTGIKMPLKECFSQNALLLVGKYIPGKIWGMVARVHQLKKFGINVNSSLHATYLEQLNSLHVGLVFGAVCWLMAIDHEFRWLALFFSLVSLIVVPIWHESIFRVLFKIVPDKWRDRFQVYTGIDMPVRDYLLLACLYFMEWLLAGVIAVFIFIVMIGEAPSLNFSWMLIGSNSVSMVAGFIAIFAPAGIGVREVVNGEMLLSVLTITEVAGLVILLRCWSVSTDIILGGIALIFRKGKLINKSGIV